MYNLRRKIINCNNYLLLGVFYLEEKKDISWNKTYNKRKMLIVFLCAVICMIGLMGRLVYLMIFEAEYYQEQADMLHERERKIKAARGEIQDRNGMVLATNQTVCTISVIHSQVKDAEKVISVLSQELGMEEAQIRAKVEKVSSREKIKSNVKKEIGDRIRSYNLNGVKVDEDYKRYYPYDDLASKVLGFTGSDNQGIIGLEVKYEKWLKGTDGTILTMTDARGIELENIAEDRIEPVAGKTLKLSLDYHIQKYAQQAAEKVMEEKQADRVNVMVLNPQNGEMYACVDVPEFNLNKPFELNTEVKPQNEEQRQEMLNQMWRNACISDTYEPGSIFKVFTASAALEEGVVSLSDQFYCPGYKIVEDRRIRCAKVGGHGSETFTQSVQNSCNPAFIEIGLRLGAPDFYKYFKKFGLMDKTGVDLPGEATAVIHKEENVGEVELATMSFGQSFQITPLQMAATVCSVINGGTRITPHFGVAVCDEKDHVVNEFVYEETKRIVSEETSENMQVILESVVREGGGNKAYMEGYEIGGKTATSQTLPRSANKYISSFIGFAPAQDAKVAAMVIIYNPKGIYYGGTIAAPVVKSLFENILPYLGVEKGE